MPELPEVETVVKGLNKLIVGKKILSVKDDNYKSFPVDANDSEVFVKGAYVKKVHRRAKMIIIDLSTITFSI